MRSQVLEKSFYNSQENTRRSSKQPGQPSLGPLGPPSRPTSHGVAASSFTIPLSSPPHSHWPLCFLPLLPHFSPRPFWSPPVGLLVPRLTNLLPIPHRPPECTSKTMPSTASSSCTEFLRGLLLPTEITVLALQTPQQPLCDLPELFHFSCQTSGALSSSDTERPMW